MFGLEAVPPNLITVHIRWGDKAIEMDLASVREYVNAVHHILDRRQQQQQQGHQQGHQLQPVNVFVSSEDPRAFTSFRNAAPDSWNIYQDAMVQEMKMFRPKDGTQWAAGPVVTQRLSRTEGTSSLASLAIAMEANEFVLVLGSNWSRLMDELRKAVVDPTCGGCTYSVNLRQGQW